MNLLCHRLDVFIREIREGFSDNFMLTAEMDVGQRSACVLFSDFCHIFRFQRLIYGFLSAYFRLRQPVYGWVR